MVFGRLGGGENEKCEINCKNNKSDVFETFCVCQSNSHVKIGKKADRIGSRDFNH